ncbi:DUF434 domain-containing protein [Tissierella creatinini]|nr:DUF434 domain-containing protein [Tissierella creatinini]TJX59710.1 DUF434 domain-containing protein [Soehngenia saccharolytica]
MSIKTTRRGYDSEDEKFFTEDYLKKFYEARDDIKLLVDRGYKLAHTTEFVGNHFQLSARQRIALKRTICSTEEVNNRKAKMLSLEEVQGGSFNIDGFNLIILLEVALSGSLLIHGDDGTIRDLAGLRGTYRIIDKTDMALNLIGKAMKDLSISNVKFFLDAPVSNSGVLRGKIKGFEDEWNIKVDVDLVPNADVILSKMERVVSSDSIILDNCMSWFNLSRYIVEKYIENPWIV